MYSLTRVKDGKGDAGPVSVCYKRIDGKLEVVSDEPVIGGYIQVGALTARSYHDQDYWVTTEIIEIVSDNTEKIIKGVTTFYTRIVEFKTKNSTYIWKAKGILKNE